MSDFRRIAAAGRSLRTLLLTAFEQEPPLDIPTNVVLIRADDLPRRKGQTLILEPAVSLLLYRIELDQALTIPDTPGRRGGDGDAGRPPLPLGLSFLVTAWGTDPDQEHRILGKTLQVLHDFPVLRGPGLDPSANWSNDDTMRVLLDDLASVDLARIFHPYGCALQPSIAILARLGG